MPGTSHYKAQALSRRRVLLTGAGAAGGILALGRPGWAQLLADVPTGGIRFDVLRGDRVVGRHEVDFRVTERRLQVETRIDVAVSVLAVVVFRYRHLGIETYVDDHLVRFESETDDDGARFRVHGDARPDGFAIATAKGMEMAPSDILVGSYWTPRVIERRLLIDPKRGRVKEQVVAGRERITLPVRGTTRPATRYRVSGIITGSVTYDDDGRWIAATLVSKGSDIVYRLRG
ncbi:MAG: hypothetical protein KF815_03030 [Rhodospirillales bacterium]|nr:hypothetical protein [Rhodospirillales bacterium]